MRDDRRSTVQPYEDCRKSGTFPMLIGWARQTLMLAVPEVTVSISEVKRASGTDTEVAG